MNATQASVVIVKPAGTSSGPSTRVISAMFAPLPPEQHAHVARALGEVVHVAGADCDRGHGPILEAPGASHMRKTTCLGVVDYGHGAA